MTATRFIVTLAAVLLWASATMAEAPSRAEEPRADEVTVLRLRVLEAERQAREQAVLRLKAEARAVAAEFPAAQRHLESKERELREAFEQAATGAGLTLREWELDLGTGAWRRRAGRP